MSEKFNYKSPVLEAKLLCEQPTADRIKESIEHIQSGAIYPVYLKDSLDLAKTQIDQIMGSDFPAGDKAKTVEICSALQKNMGVLDTRRVVEVHDSSILAANDDNYQKAA